MSNLYLISCNARTTQPKTIENSFLFNEHHTPHRSPDPAYRTHVYYDNYSHCQHAHRETVTTFIVNWSIVSTVIILILFIIVWTLMCLTGYVKHSPKLYSLIHMIIISIVQHHVMSLCTCYMLKKKVCFASIKH